MIAQPRKQRRRGGGNVVPVQFDPHRGYRISIPRALAEAQGLRGAWVEVQPEGEDALRLIIIRPREGA